MNTRSRTINISNSGLNFSQNTTKPKKVEYLPSVEEFSTEVDKVLEQNTLSLPYSQGEINRYNRPGGFKKAKEFKEANETETLRYATSCMNQFFSNPIITSYLARREVTVNAFGIPSYTKAERTIYDCKQVPYISFRNPNWERCPEEIGLFGWGTRYMNASDWQKEYCEPYKKLAVAYLGKGNLDIPEYNAFNFLGAVDTELKLILIKNNNKIKQHKEANIESSQLKGVHYLDHAYDSTDIICLIDSIKSGKFTLEEVNRNIFIFVFNNCEGHYVCGTLVINSENIKNPIVSELFLFDSQQDSDDISYALNLENALNEKLGDQPPIKLTHMCYNVQIHGMDDFDGYELDCNCPFYSVRTANKLVEIIGSSEDSAFRARILSINEANHSDTPEDITIYVNKLAKRLPDLFDYDLESGSYRAKSYKDREVCNIAARWDTGRRSLKNYIRQYASDHQLPQPVFKIKMEQ